MNSNVFLFSFNSKYFLISLLISLTHGLFSVWYLVFNYFKRSSRHHSVIYSQFNSTLAQNILCMTYILLNILTCFMVQLGSLVRWIMYVFNFSICLLIFCSLVLPITIKGFWKFFHAREFLYFSWQLYPFFSLCILKLCS